MSADRARGDGLRGRLDSHLIDSAVLEGNPLGDPARRPLYVYVPEGVDEEREEAYPAVYVIQGYTGRVDMWLNRSPFEPTMTERLDRLFSDDGCPPALVVFVDARYPTVAHRDRRALTGKSSGGYGAMVVPMVRPDVFGALASHAGDALFEASYLPDFPGVARSLRDDYGGSYDVFFERLATAERMDWATFGKPLETYGY